MPHWLKVLNSPFKLPRLKWYIGETAVGVPYFLPRKWVPNTEKSGYLKAVPIKIGFDSCTLGWKTKWEETDYRWEWSPILSFSFFKWQIACTVIVDYPDHYWTSWLYYSRNTDKHLSKKERLEQCKINFPQIYTVWRKGEEKMEVDYYNLILKKKYL